MTTQTIQTDSFSSHPTSTGPIRAMMISPLAQQAYRSKSWGNVLNSITTEIQGHRGNNSRVPENTIESFIDAAKAGAHTLELDVLLTKDMKMVIHHNFRQNPKVCLFKDGSPLETEPLIRDLTFEYLREKVMVCGSGTSRVLKGYNIPTLEELLKLGMTDPYLSKVNFNIEIKSDPNGTPLTFEPTVIVSELTKILKETAVSHDRIRVSSFDSRVLELMRAEFPWLIIGILTNEKFPLENLLQRAQKVAASIVSPPTCLLKSKEDVARFQRLGYSVIVWSDATKSHVHEDEWARMVQLGVNGIITDHPADLQNFL